MKLNPLNSNLTEEEIIEHYRSRHAITKNMSDEQMSDLIDFARKVGHLIFKNEQQRLSERAHAKPFLLAKGYTEAQVKSYYDEIKFIGRKISKKNKKIDKDYKAIMSEVKPQ